MNFNNIGPGDKTPDLFNVIIEIPSHAHPVKYEVDKDTGALFVDRFINTAMQYPCNYGYIPHTLADDGDPVDVLVLTPVPLISGSVISCRAVGMLNMTDESGEDAKILAVPADKLCQRYRNVKAHTDLPEDFISTVEHFFEHYKDLEHGKWVKIAGWVDTQAANNEVLAGIERYKTAE